MDDWFPPALKLMTRAIEVGGIAIIVLGILGRASPSSGRCCTAGQDRTPSRSIARMWAAPSCSGSSSWSPPTSSIRWRSSRHFRAYSSSAASFSSGLSSASRSRSRSKGAGPGPGTRATKNARQTARPEPEAGLADRRDMPMIRAAAAAEHRSCVMRWRKSGNAGPRSTGSPGSSSVDSSSSAWLFAEALARKPRMRRVQIAFGPAVVEMSRMGAVDHVVGRRMAGLPVRALDGGSELSHRKPVAVRLDRERDHRGQAQRLARRGRCRWPPPHSSW